MAPVRGHAMAKAALEMALLDAYLRGEGRSLADYLGATQRSVPAGANIGIDTPAAAIDAIGQTLEAGYQRIKCKIAPGHDVDLLRAVRSEYPDLVLSADANGAYDLDNSDDVAALHKIDEFGLIALEQPLRPDDLVGHAKLTAELSTPVMLDESVTSIGSLNVALALDACRGVSVKPARVGGVLAARTIHDRCVAEGVHLAIGGMLETGIGRAAALAVAGMPGFDIPGDLGGSERYFSPDVTVPHELRDGQLEVPTGPGIGVEPLPAVISSARVRNRVFRGP
jgi:O-succinylbenzoate synthase